MANGDACHLINMVGFNKAKVVASVGTELKVLFVNVQIAHNRNL
jgi:hypothetical protein